MLRYAARFGVAVLMTWSVASAFGQQSEDDAIGAATAATGLPDLPGAVTTGRQVTISDSPIPFLAKTINGRAAWQVDIANVSLSGISGDKKDADRFIRVFHVLLDRNSGQLLSISSSGFPQLKSLRPEGSAEWAEKQFLGSREAYIGLPEAAPAVTFFGALKAVLTSGTAVLAAQEISAVYVMETENGSDPRPVWAISFRGLPAFPAAGDRANVVPEWQRDHIRVVVNAQTGGVIFATTVPQPM